MKIGIVGLPNVGKSTLFKALTKKQVDINNYPFCTIEPNVGIVEVPDERLLKLAKMSESAKIVPAIVEFVDIAGLVKGASEGEGLGNKFLSHIREVDAIVEVVRVFKNEKITHVHNKIDPREDIETINTELILADLETVGKRAEKLRKEARGSDKEAAIKLKIAEEIKNILGEGRLANSFDISFFKKDSAELAVVRELSLLTMKPFLYVYNISGDENGKIKMMADGVCLDIKIEEELIEMLDEEKKELGLKSDLKELIVKSYELLNLITFFTTGKDESRAWTIKKNSTAPQAGAAIHTDFEEKFIRADVIAWDELLKIGSWGKAREAGKIRTVGKDYVVGDGEVIEFKI